MPATFIIRQATNGQFHFNLTAANNKIILSSETYHDKSGAQGGGSRLSRPTAPPIRTTSAGRGPAVTRALSSWLPTRKSLAGARGTPPSHPWSAASPR
jgi:uncharacterized protein YegP (UPF0339 family)